MTDVNFVLHSVTEGYHIRQVLCDGEGNLITTLAQTKHSQGLHRAIVTAPNSKESHGMMCRTSNAKCSDCQEIFKPSLQAIASSLKHPNVALDSRMVSHCLSFCICRASDFVQGVRSSVCV
jgi:hypothetical protein